MPTIHLEIPALAVPKGRPRFFKGVAMTPQKTRSFEAELRWHWRQSKHPMVPKVPTQLTAVCHFPYPASMRKKNRPIYPITKPDGDNLLKAIGDSLNGFAWHDDSQLYDQRVIKVYTDGSPMIILRIDWEDE